MLQIEESKCGLKLLQCLNQMLYDKSFCHTAHHCPSSFRLLSFRCFGPYTRLAVFKLQTSKNKNSLHSSFFYMLSHPQPQFLITDSQTKTAQTRRPFSKKVYNGKQALQFTNELCRPVSRKYIFSLSLLLTSYKQSLG